jgi:HK97 family phage major capsid protein
MPTPVSEEQQLQDLNQRMLGKSKAEQAEILRGYMNDQLGVKPETPKEPVVQLSEEQFNRVFTGAIDEARKVAKEAADDTQQKYDLSRGAAKSAAEDAVAKFYREKDQKDQENKIIAKRFASIFRQLKGTAKPGEYQRALDEEVEYMKKTYGREHRAMTLGDDTTGGYLAPELWETRVYQNLPKTSVARRKCTLIDMTGREILRLPKMTGGLTAYGRTEMQGGTTSQLTFSQFVLQPKTFTVFSKPVSLEMMEAGDPAIADLITQDASRSFGRREDVALFQGDDTIGVTGLLEQSTNVVYLGGASDSGKTSAAQITFDDLFNLQDELDEEYMPDEDTQGSGGIQGGAEYWLHRRVINQLRKLRGDDQYFWDVRDMASTNQIGGLRYHRCKDAVYTTTANTKFAVCGNLSSVYVGYRPGIRIDMLKEGIVDNVNLGTSVAYAFRFVEFWDHDVIDDEALAILSTSAT